MSGPSKARAIPIADRSELIEFIERGCKPAAEWRVGTEHEKFIFRRGDNRPVAHEGEAGIGRVLALLGERTGWEPVREGDSIIALTHGLANVTLEPGGQFELSGAPLETIHETDAETRQHLADTKAITDKLGLGMLGLGFNPKWRREDVPWMPKGRYRIMRAYMPTKGSLGLDMMIRTCTVQANLDFASEADMVRKFRVSLALQPIATALFANSPFTKGRPNGFKSYRSHIWTDTDPDRTGDLPFVFEDGFGFERYVDYALDVPMYFVYRDGQYIDASGQSFRDFLAGKLPACPGEQPLRSDWGDHLTTLFPEVRLKRILEMRGADCGSAELLAALPALWVGILYDETALGAAWDLVKGWSSEERAGLRAGVPRHALATPFRRGTVRDIAREMLAIARAGLARRARIAGGGDETRYLAPLDEIVERNETPADRLLALYQGRWHGDIDQVFTACSY